MGTKCVRVASFTLVMAFAGLHAADVEGQSEVRAGTAEDGVVLRYEVAGLENPGLAIVFVHGWSNNRSFAKPRFDRLGITRPVVALDLPGFGESGVDRTSWSMEAYGRDILSVIDDLQLEEVVLVGHSMGAAAVLAAAGQNPDRIAGVVTIDWLQDPYETYDAEFIRTWRADYEKGFRDPGWIREVGFSEASPDSIVMRYIENMPAQVPPHWWLIADHMFEWASERLVPTLASLDLPILAINTDGVPTQVEAYKRLTPSFEYRVISGKGHIGILWEDQDMFDDYLFEFLGSLGR